DARQNPVPGSAGKACRQTDQKSEKQPDNGNDEGQPRPFQKQRHRINRRRPIQIKIPVHSLSPISKKERNIFVTPETPMNPPVDGPTRVILSSEAFGQTT